MLRRSIASLLVLLAFACSSSTPPTPSTPPSTPRSQSTTSESLDLFRERSLTGSFVLRDLKTGKTTVVGRDDAKTRHVPFSTFKIPNSMIGLETGVIPDESFSLKWNGHKYWLDDWNRDHDLTSAIKFSVVWFYQEVARRIGEERMRSWVTRLDYGNHDIGTTSKTIDSFWLDDGSIRISPLEQIAFIERLVKRELQITERTRDILMRIVPTEDEPTARGQIIHGKTGLGNENGHVMGWYVGWLSAAADANALPDFVFATHVEGHTASNDPQMKNDELKRLIPLRRQLTRALLERELRLR